MSLWDIFLLIGGLAVFLYGMLLMNDSLTAFAGEKLKGIMLTLTRSKVRGYLTGLGITVINQSSSATTVLEAVLVGAGLISFRQSLAITLGAELGSTVLGQLVAIPKLTLIAPIILAAGFFASLLARSKRSRNICLIVFGFGVLFLGMEMMSRALESFRNYRPFLDFMTSVEHPLLGVLVGLVFTMIIQSSGATSGLVIAMAISGAITVEQAVPINLGASIGTCITAVLGSLALNWEAKRSAYIHVLFQTIGVGLVYVLLSIPFDGGRLWLTLVRELTLTLFGSADPARQIAMAHTMMPLVNHLLVIPLLPLIVRAFDLVFPPMRAPEVFGPVHINDGLLVQPELAIEQAKKEIVRTAGIVEAMLERSRQLFGSPAEGPPESKAGGRAAARANGKAGEEINALDQKVDLLRNAVVAFLTRVAGASLNEEQSRRVVFYLFAINELENLADVIDVNILGQARKLDERDVQLQAESCADLAAVHALLLKNYRRIAEAFQDDDLDRIRSFLDKRRKFRDLQAEIRDQHFDRLRRGKAESMASNPIFMDVLGHYSRINRHMIHIAKKTRDHLAEHPRPSRAKPPAGSAPEERRVRRKK